MHPLVEDFSKLTDAELQERLTKINRVIRQTGNGQVIAQAMLIRDALMEDQNRRYRELMDKSVNNTKLSDSIDIS